MPSRLATSPSNCDGVIDPSACFGIESVKLPVASATSVTAPPVSSSLISFEAALTLVTM